MADNNQQQQQQQKGGGGNKAATGISISGALAPEDVNNKEKLSGLFTVLSFGALAMLGIAHVAPLVRTKLFGCQGDAPKSIDKNEVFNFVRSDQPIGLKASLVQSILNSVDDEGKAKISAIVGGGKQQEQAAPAEKESKSNGKKS